MRSHQHSRQGFTILEVASTLVILGIFASIAVPVYTDMTLRSQRAEVQVNSDGLFEAVHAYITTGEPAEAINLDFNPKPSPSDESVNGKTLRSWGEGVGAAEGAVWEQIGWQPDGDVRCSYAVTWTGPLDADNYATIAECDLDNDGARVLYYVVGPGSSASGVRKEAVDVYPLHF